MSHATHPSQDLIASGEPRRVIVVGRTGLDAKLRLDPGVELIRVRGGLEALGEIAEPMRGGPSGPAVVIVGLGTELGDGSQESGERLAQFAEAVRRIDPGVLLLHVDGVKPPKDAGFGLVPDLTESGRLFDHLSVDARRLPDDPVIEEQDEDACLWAGDRRLVECLMAGRPVGELAMELLGARVGSEHARFVEDPEDVRDGDAVEPVSYSGRGIGWIVVAAEDCDAALRAELPEHAAWLGAWLALSEQHARLRVEAFSDPVTGAWNRRYFDRFIRTSVDHARRHRHRLTLLIFDIDDFKAFNDRFGHTAGDEILAETVKLLKSVIRPSDRVCRVGGDEFAVVFYEPEGPRSPNSEHPTTVFEVARRFQEQINQQRFPKLGLSAPGQLTVSGGLATFPWDGATVEELISRADELAMQSKQQGKNAITLGPGAERVRRDG